MRAILNAVAAAGLLAFIPARALASEYVVVANRSVAETAVSRAQLSRIFLRVATQWPDGQHARPVDQAKSSPVRATFSRAVVGKSVDAAEQYWVQAIFSGRAVPPLEKRSDAEVLSYVRDTPGAVGYVAADTPLPEGVKKLTVKD
jgi:ABC-type phosphate transport system substrate-binding protein